MRYISFFLFFSMFVMMSMHHTVYAEEELTSIPEKNISLWAEEDQKESIFKNFKLKINNQVYHFKNWYNVTNPTYYPKMVFDDITGDKIPEIIIILTEGTGTGVNVTKAHVLQKKDSVYSEIPIESPLGIIKVHVKTLLNEKEAVITIDGKTEKIDIRPLEIDPSNLAENVAFGSFVYYFIEKNALCVDVGAAISPASYIGDIRIKYKFKNNKLIVDNIFFKK